MDIREFAREVFNTFFIIFTCAILGWLIHLRLLGAEIARLSDVTAIFIICIPTTLAGFVLYSKRELKRLELLVRHLIHLIIIMGIVLPAASHIGWILWSAPITVIRFVGMIMGIYIAVCVIDFYQSKKLADKLNEKLKERYRG